MGKSLTLTCLSLLLLSTTAFGYEYVWQFPTNGLSIEYTTVGQPSGYDYSTAASAIDVIEIRTADVQVVTYMGTGDVGEVGLVRDPGWLTNSAIVIRANPGAPLDLSTNIDNRAYVLADTDEGIDIIVTSRVHVYGIPILAAGFRGVNAQHSGGQIVFSPVTIDSCVFIGNKHFAGSPIIGMLDVSPQAEANTVHAPLTAQNCVFYGNQTNVAIDVASKNTSTGMVNLINNTIIDSWGVGIAMDESGSINDQLNVRVTNNIVVGTVKALFAGISPFGPTDISNALAAGTAEIGYTITSDGTADSAADTATANKLNVSGADLGIGPNDPTPDRNSPARHAGTEVLDVDRDATGRKRSQKANDIGAAYIPPPRGM